MVGVTRTSTYKIIARDAEAAVVCAISPKAKPIYDDITIEITEDDEEDD